MREGIARLDAAKHDFRAIFTLVERVKKDRDSLGLDGRPFGSDLGFLPGDAKSKIRPYMQPMLAAVDTLLGAGVFKVRASRGGSGRVLGRCVGEKRAGDGRGKG